MKDKELKQWVRQAAEEFESSPETAARLRSAALSVQPTPSTKLPVWRKVLAGGLVSATALVVAVGGWAFANEWKDRQSVFAEGLASITAEQFESHAGTYKISVDSLPASERTRFTENSNAGKLLGFGLTYREDRMCVRLDFTVNGYAHPDLFLNEGLYQTEEISGHKVQVARTEADADYYIFQAGETVCYLMVRFDPNGTIAKDLIRRLA